ncbi:MAG: hypothetical protein ACO3M0_05415, partial [Candidatus Nanopelagicaceae bacterium]
MITQCRLILGVVGSDVHCVANQLLEVEFRNHGYAVINLGVALDEGVILQSLSGEGNEFVLLGTINGDIEPAISEIKAVRARYSKNVVIVVGGNVVLGAIGRDRTLD